MDIMVIFHAITVVFGLYMAVSAHGMRKGGTISSLLATPEELAACRDKKGFIDFFCPKEQIFGGIAILAGALGLAGDFLIPGRWPGFVAMALLLAAFLWFWRGFMDAKAKYM